MRSLLLIDGSSMLTTSYFGTMPSSYYKAKSKEEKEHIFDKLLKTSSGKYVNAVYPMMKTIVSILKEQKPSHILVAWDMTRNTFRRDIYSEYKGTRSETDYPLKEQFATMQEILNKLHIPQAMSIEFEADDFLGSYANKFQDEIIVKIMTKDRDSLQLCDKNTRVWLVTGKADELNSKYGIDTSEFNLPKNVFEYSPLYIYEEYGGLIPSQLVDLKALVGDTSDNIPGVKGVGEKAAIPLIKEYGDIENLYATIKDMDKNEEKEIKTFWKEYLGISRSPLSYLLKKGEDGDILGEEAAFLSKKLGQIKVDIAVEHTLDDLEYSFDNNIKTMTNVFDEFEFKSLIKTYLK